MEADFKSKEMNPHSNFFLSKPKEINNVLYNMFSISDKIINNLILPYT